MPDPLILARSAYSLLRGSALPGALAAAAARHGQRALVLADRDNLYGALAFLDATRAEGVRGLLGAELTLEAPGGGRERAVLLCRELAGYQSLSVILTRRRLEGPRSAEEALRAGARGLTLLADSPGLLRRLQPYLPRRDLGALLLRPGGSGPREAELLDLAKRESLAVVASCPLTMCSPAEAATQRLLALVRRRELAGETRAVPAAAAARRAGGRPGGPGGGRDGDALPRTPDQARRLFLDMGAALRGARELAERCTLTLAELTPPRFILPVVAGREAPGRLRARCAEGLARRGLARSAAAGRRLAEELGVITTLGFADYFLIVDEIVAWAHARGIRTVGRGSGAASLVAYLLGVTNVDPLRYGLCFERFLHPLRRDLPDLDIDIAWDRREEVLAFAVERFGPRRAAMVGTHQFFHARGAFRAAARALGLEDSEIARGSRRLPHTFFGALAAAADPASGGRALGERAAGEGAPGERAPGEAGLDAAGLPGAPPPDERGALEELARDRDASLRRAARAGSLLLGLPRQLGTHPGGLVLADGPLERVVPLERAPSGLLVTQFEMRAVERIGLVKIDLLGNRALATVGEALAGAGVESAIPEEDAATGERLAHGETLGCFQIESPAMRTLLRQLRPRDLDAVIAAVALIRPGPSASGMKRAFLRRAHGEEPAEVLHPALRPLLESTWGLPLYEEDIIRIAATIAGTSLAEGDLLRRAVGEAARRARGAPPESEAARALASLAAGFVAASGRNGVDRRTAELAWADLVRFSTYAFCKAHAAGYGVLAYQQAWLKTHHAGPFFAALLNHQRGMYPAWVYVDEARRCGLALRPPCIARSAAGWRWEREDPPGALRCGLGDLRGLRAGVLARLLEARDAGPFRDLRDLARRAGANRVEMEALVLCGACDEAFGLPRGELLWRLQRLAGRAAPPAERDARQETLALATAAPEALGRTRGWRAPAVAHRAQLERRLLGFSLALHPMALLPVERPVGALSIASAIACAGGGGGGGSDRAAAGGSGSAARATIVGLVAARRRIRGRDGRPLLFTTLEDESGLLECVCDDRRLARGLPGFSVGSFLEARGRVALDRGAPSLRVETLRVLGVY